MLKSLWIKLPTVGIALLVLLLVERPLAMWLAGGVVLVGLAALAWVVCNVKSSFLARTVWRAPQATNSIALTFDDGPEPSYTNPVLEILAERQVQAAFFVVGDRVRAHPELLARIHAEGHLVGNHTDTHGMLFHCRLWGFLRREINGCNQAIQSVIGCVPKLFRSPQGFKNPALGDVLREVSMTAVGWQVRGRDAVSSSAVAIETRVVEGAEAGGVILLHDGSGLGGTNDRTATLEALPAIIDRLRAKGLRFVRLDELLGVEAYRRLDAS